jgi:hypothetical protein
MFFFFKFLTLKFVLMAEQIKKAYTEVSGRRNSQHHCQQQKLVLQHLLQKWDPKIAVVG